MANELAKKDKKDLEKELDQKLVALRDLRFGTAHSKSRNVKERKGIKREIARIKTTLTQKREA